MSKLFEALQEIEPALQRVGETRRVPLTPIALRPVASSRQSMDTLHRSLDSALPGIANKVVLFAASRGSEGTTTIVREFATTLSAVFNAAVLVVDANPNRGAAHACGNRNQEALSLPALLRGLKVHSAERGQLPGVTVAVFDSAVANSPEGQALSIENLGDALREHFDYVLFDAPALSNSSTALSLARHADGVVIVIDSKRTRWPVVENTKKGFESTGAKVLGVILNKRVFYIPQWIYRWL